MEHGGTNAEGLDSRTRLILAGEQLFAENGLGGASMREIATRAGQANHAAVQYHFGSREGLVRAIFDYRMEQMESIRGDMLRKIERTNEKNDARRLIEIILIPQLELQSTRSYASFLSQYLLTTRSSTFGDFGGSSPPNLTMALDQLRRIIAYLPEHVAQRRLISVSLMFLNILVRHHGADEAEAAESFEDALEDTLDQIVAVMCMPLRSKGEHPGRALVGG
jgi:AcrR family transcriptional regulator